MNSLDEARAFLRGLPFAASRLFDPLPAALDQLATELSRQWGFPLPRAALAHFDQRLNWHRDKLNPYPCINMLIVFRHGCEGGALEMRDGRRFSCPDGMPMLFDGQVEHRVERFTLTPGGYRIGLTYYVPT